MITLIFKLKLKFSLFQFDILILFNLILVLNKLLFSKHIAYGIYVIDYSRSSWNRIYACPNSILSPTLTILSNALSGIESSIILILFYF